MAGDRAQDLTAKALRSLYSGLGLDESEAVDVGGLALSSVPFDRGPPLQRRKETAAAAAGQGGRGEGANLGLARPSSSQGDAANSSTRGAAATAAGHAKSSSKAAANASRPLRRPPQRGDSVLLQGAQAEAARKALALNLKLQAALRKELGVVDETLKQNTEILKAAEERITSNRCVGITTSSEKFRWSKAVAKFLSLQAHPGKLGLHKEQETMLRSDPIPWQARDVKALRSYISENYPEAVVPTTAQAALRKIDWEKVAHSVDETTRRDIKRQRLRRIRTADECKMRWTHVDMPGAASDAAWTKEEDLALMMQAEEKCGREWVKIAEEVQKASGSLKRRPAIAYLRRFQGTLNTKLLRRNNWSQEEDQMLVDAIKRNVSKAWLTVARDVPGRSSIQCLTRSLKLDLQGAGAVPPPKHQRSGTDTEDGRAAPDEGNDQSGDEGVLDGGPQHHPEAGIPVAVPDAEHQDYLHPCDTMGPGRGMWTLLEDRYLCLAVRALMPQEKRKGALSTGAGVEGMAAGDNNPKRAGDGKGKGRKRRRDDDGESSIMSPSPSGISSGPLGGAGTKEDTPRHNHNSMNTLDCFKGVDWQEVARLMSNGRVDVHCRRRWFDALDPSVNRDREWEEEEDAQLRKSIEARGIGDWISVEKDMANWAFKKGMRRRTDQWCRRRFRILEPEKTKKHQEYVQDRREVEPRLNVARGATHRLAKTEITLEDFDLVEDDVFEGTGDNDDDDDGEDDDQGW